MNILSLASPQSNFRDKEIVKCVERALQRFDPKLSVVAFSKFEVDHALAKEDIVFRPELFARILQQIFRFGSRYVEKEILNELKKEFGLVEVEHLTLAGAIRQIRQ